MSGLLLDTHAWAWALTRDRRLSQRALETLAQAEVVWVSAMSIYEVGQKVRLGKWPEMTTYADALPALVERQGGKIAAIGGAVAARAALMDWPHRDPFDRFIAATAMELKVALVSADAAFDGLGAQADWRGRVW